MNGDWFTASIVLGTFVIWIWLDVVIVKVSGAPTESQWIAATSQRFTIFPFIVGLLSGHWFFNHRVLSYSAWVYALPIFIWIIAFDVYWNTRRWGQRAWYRYAGLWFLLGLPVGTFLWGQMDGGAPF